MSCCSGSRRESSWGSPLGTFNFLGLSCDDLYSDSDEFEDARSTASDDKEASYPILRSVQERYGDDEIMSNDVDADSLQTLQQRFVGVPTEELLRFYQGAKKQIDLASQRLEWMLQWRAKHPASVIQAAEDKCKEAGFLLSGGRSQKGHKIVFIQGARYDPLLASPEEYVLSCVAMLDRTCPRGSQGQVVVMHDLRPGHGWPNKSALNMVSFIKAFIPVFANMYPERLANDIIYPMPWLGVAVWNIIRSLLDPVTAEKMVILRGNDDADSPVPEDLSKWVAYEALPKPTQCRHKNMILAKEAE